MAQDMIAEGDQKSEDRRSWQVEITNRANQPVLTVAFAEVLCPTATGSQRQSDYHNAALKPEWSQP
jgi:hypothetical protein